MYITEPQDLNIMNNRYLNSIEKIHPGVSIEFGYDETSTLVTAVAYKDGHLHYVYTNEHHRRDGYATEHIKSLLSRGLINKSATPTTNTIAQKMLLGLGFIPYGFYKPIFNEEGDLSPVPYISYGWGKSKHKEIWDIKMDEYISPFHNALKVLVEDSIIIEKPYTAI